MSGSRKTTRRRKVDIQRERAEREATAQASREEAHPFPARPAPSSGHESPAPRLRADDLQALADMDPRELEAMMADSLGGRGVEEGDTARGRVSRVTPHTVFVDVGAKSEGLLPREESPDASVGDLVEAFVVHVGEQGIHLSRDLPKAFAAHWLARAKEERTPVEGVITGRNSGGFDVRIGEVSAFCPLSQIDRHADADLDAYVGVTHTFRVIEAGDKVVLSRRVLLEEELAERRDSLWLGLTEGELHTGTVAAVRDFGVFVDIGGVEGLLPSRDLGHADDPRRTALQRGRSVDVRVLRIDRESRRLTLGLPESADASRSATVAEQHPGALGTFADLLGGVKL